MNAIIDIHRGSDGAYGVPRVVRELRRGGWWVNHKRVERLMRANGIVGVHQRRGVRTTIRCEDNPPVPDLVGRGFDPGRPHVAWCGDIERHEALSDRVGVGDLHRRAVAAAGL